MLTWTTYEPAEPRPIRVTLQPSAQQINRDLVISLRAAVGHVMDARLRERIEQVLERAESEARR